MVGFDRTWRRIVLVSLGGTLLAAAPTPADVYFYRDADGVFHFTNAPGPKVERFEMGEESDRETQEPRTIRHRSFRDRSHYDELIYEFSSEYDVEPALIKAVIRAESGFDRMATSPKGARGLMQLMPFTARRHGVSNPYNPRENIRGGVRHLRLLLDRFQRNVPWALAAYNAGSGAVRRYRGIPPYAETQTYVRRVLQFRRHYQRQERLALQ